jgi:hypothetical protein
LQNSLLRDFQLIGTTVRIASKCVGWENADCRTQELRPRAKISRNFVCQLDG